MHGRKRSEYKALQRDTKVAAKLASKAVAWHQLQAALLQRRQNNTVDTSTTTIESTLQLIEKAVTVNPDPIWLWNYRRELLQQRHDDNEWWTREQQVTQTSLTNNPKAYAAWHHRKWCLQQYLVLLAHTTTTTAFAAADTTLQQELGLTALFFQRDERNFHCWSYRRFVVSCCLWNVTASEIGTLEGMVPPPPTGEWKMSGDSPDSDDDVVWMGAQIAAAACASAATNASTSGDSSLLQRNINEAVLKILMQEWEFTEQKIRDNFSNFSAFHYRSKLLPMLLQLKQQQGNNKDNNNDYLQWVIASEFELVANAVFTEPDDQTAWWYQRFLLDFMKQQQQEQDAVLNWYQDEILLPHLEQLRELQQETANNSKWVLVGVLQCNQYCSSPGYADDSTNERRSILNRLIELDSDRKERYKHLLRRLEKNHE
jgi:Protein prenyltransferase alpha subunit repeat